jgi:hypothetical protein
MIMSTAPPVQLGHKVINGLHKKIFYTGLYFPLLRLRKRGPSPVIGMLKCYQNKLQLHRYKWNPATHSCEMLLNTNYI